MAVYDNIDIITMIAGEDLNDDQGKLLMINSVGRVVLATSVNVPVIGILAENPKLRSTVADDSTGRDVPVCLLKGVIKAKALGNVTAGNMAIWGTGALVTDGGASLVSAIADTFVLGVFRESGVANQMVEIVGLPLVSGGS